MGDLSQEIRDEMVSYIVENYISSYNFKTMPLDESLVELGVLDSYGVIELVTFIESNWDVVIKDSEITKEKFGSINKMKDLVILKLSDK